MTNFGSKFSNIFIHYNFFIKILNFGAKIQTFFITNQLINFSKDIYFSTKNMSFTAVCIMSHPSQRHIQTTSLKSLKWKPNFFTSCWHLIMIIRRTNSHKKEDRSSFSHQPEKTRCFLIRGHCLWNVQNCSNWQKRGNLFMLFCAASSPFHASLLITGCAVMYIIPLCKTLSFCWWETQFSRG